MKSLTKWPTVSGAATRFFYKKKVDEKMRLKCQTLKKMTRLNLQNLVFLLA